MKAVMFAGSVVLASCAVVPDVGSVEQETGKCPDWGCGLNSPVIANRGFYELNLDHVANAAGFKYEQFVKNGTDYDLMVTNGIITGRHGNTVIGGGNLVGAQIWVTDGSTEYAIQINAVDATDFWAIPQSGIPQVLQSYVFQWETIWNGVPKNDWTDLCSLPMDDTLGQDAHHTVVFEGDRIDAKSKTVSPNIDARWFNLGCAGSALAKMYLTGHVRAAAAAGFDTTWDQRQTILKMFSADYCGNGTPFTVGGTPLRWADRAGTMKITDNADLEARWNRNGASCLMKPRIAVNATQLGQDTFPDIFAAIKDECSVPECADTSLDPGHDDLISANPVLP